MAPPGWIQFYHAASQASTKKIIVLVEFVIHGGLRTPWVYRSSYALMVRFYRNQRVCLCTHTLVFLTALRLRKRHLFFLPPSTGSWQIQ